MAHDLENPRTRRYSKLRSLIGDIELIFKKGFLFFWRKFKSTDHQRFKKNLWYIEYKKI